MGTGRTGEYTVILSWFEQNPGVWLTAPELANAWAIDRVKARNAIAIGLKRNLITREAIIVNGHKSSRFRLREPNEKREEFQVARPSARPAKPEPMAFPVLTECDPGMATNELVAHLPEKAGDRIQFLNPSTAIIWNSAEQRENMRRLAMSQ